MIEDILKETRAKMTTTVNVFREELNGIRSGRASTALVDKLEVEYYGQATELRQLATISTPEPMQILIRPYDKSALKSIEKAIQQSNLGMTPNVEGDQVRLNMPPLTKQRRQELVKLLHGRMEDARVAIRNIRRGANDDLKEFEKEGMISEDEHKTGLDEVQKMTDKFIGEIDMAGRDKEKEILDN